MVPNVTVILQRFTTEWAAHLQPESILAACGEAGYTTWRDRMLTPVTTIQLFLLQMLRVKCAHESAGKRDGTSGYNIGHAHLKWAFSEAAVLFLVDSPPGQQYDGRLEKTYGPGKALTILAHTLARAVYNL